MMSENNGHTQTIKDRTEVEILEQHHTMRDDLDLIEQNRLQDAERQVALKAVERYLDGQEYDLVKLTAEIKAHFYTMATAYVEIGRRLLAIKAVEGHGNFTTWLNENCPVSPRQAQNLMLVARKLEQRPELAFLAKGGISKALILLDMPDEYLDECQQEGTIDGTPVDEYQTMSRKELAEKIKKLEVDREKIIAEGNKTLTVERDALLRETERLQKFVPAEDATPEWCLEKIKGLSKAVRDAVTLRRQFLCDDRLKDDFPTQAKIETEFSWMRKELDSLEREWNDTFNPEV